jgi:two-component system NtrC family response regulator
MNSKTILIVDDDESLRTITRMQLEDLGYRVIAAAGGEEALAVLPAEPVALMITDLKMPGMSGMDLLKRTRAEFPETQVIVITAYGTIGNAVEAVKAGALDYITKPIDFDQLAIVVGRALERHDLLAEIQTLRTTLDRKFGFEAILGRSEALLAVLDQAARAAQSKATVLIRGETGTGKELLAKAIHANSSRKHLPFATINCGAIPRELLESELFGHVKGSFTGAIANKRGRVEAADGGTVFLDEIGEMPLELQVKLLRLIQEGEIEKVGATAPAKVDVRIIAATHRNLLARVEDGAFREDLYYRLAVIPLDLPPLRDRSEDIPELVQHFFLKSRQKHGRADLAFPSSLLPHFKAYGWPGNVRELENVIERLVVLAAGNEIGLDDLPEPLRRQRPVTDVLPLELPAQGISLEAVERDLILLALKRFHWNQTHAAKYLDISRKTLIYRMEKHGIQRGHAPDRMDSAGT